MKSSRQENCVIVCSLDSCGVGCPSDGWREGREAAKMKLVHALSSELTTAEQGMLQRAKKQIWPTDLVLSLESSS